MVDVTLIYQIAADLADAISLMREGKTYEEIAAYISDTGPYSLSRQQVQADVAKVKWELMARSRVEVEQAIAEEVDGIEFVIAEAKAALKDSQYIKQYASLLRVLLDAGGKRSKVLGVDAHLNNQNLSAAMERVAAAGFDIIEKDGGENYGGEG